MFRDLERCYRAIRAQDDRFGGMFITGVTSTSVLRTAVVVDEPGPGRGGMMTYTYYTRLNSPIGTLTLRSDGHNLTGLHMEPYEPGPAWKLDRGPFAEVGDQLERYFAGESKTFDVPLAPSGTPFQLKVWSALRTIPYGTVTSYAEIARRIGSPRAVRAVGGANRANHIAIIIPCHRVIGTNGTLTGFGGGLDRKMKLLAVEGLAYAR